MNRDVFGGVLLVAGTSIGAGMLALPVVTAQGGFFPAAAIYFISWLFMACTGLLFLELCLRLPPNANLLTMSSIYLGRWGKGAALLLYLFLFYSLSVAYISGGGGLLADWLSLDRTIAQGLFVFSLAPFVYAGAKKIDRINRFLMIGLIGSYFLFVFWGISCVETKRLGFMNWGASLISLPVVFTSFSYQGIIPSLTAYLQRDAAKVRKAILGGSAIVFFIYLIWEFLILGAIPAEELEKARVLGLTAVSPLKEHIASSWLILAGQIFAFCAIATSFLGVAMGLLDFLADGFQLVKRGWRRFLLAVLTFSPPFAVALWDPALFIKALILAGGIGCAILLGLFPTLMVWRARYQGVGQHGSERQLGGGKPLLFLFFLFIAFEILHEILLLD